MHMTILLYFVLAYLEFINLVKDLDSWSWSFSRERISLQQILEQTIYMFIKPIGCRISRGQSVCATV